MAGEWNRLTRHAKRAVMGSQDLAASLGAATVEPEHLLVALMDDASSAACAAVLLAGQSLDDMRVILDERVAAIEPAPEPAEKPAFGPSLKQTVEQAAAGAGAAPVGTEHLLLSALAVTPELYDLCSLSPEGMAQVLTQLSGHELFGRAAPSSVGVAPHTGISYPAAIRPDSEAPLESRPGMMKIAEAPGGMAGADTRAHTLMALARLLVDMSVRASNVARGHGSGPLADQLDRMRGEVEALMKTARPQSWLAGPPSGPGMNEGAG